MIKQFLYLSILYLLLPSCGKNASKTSDDTVSYGKIRVVADESLQPLVEVECNAFMALNNAATIEANFEPEGQAIIQMLNDSARVVFTARELNAPEKQVFEQQKLKYRSFRIAIDGVALITNIANTDSLITMSEVKDILTGKKKTWKELSGGKFNEKITMVFDNNNSSNLSYMMQRFGLTNRDEINFFALQSNKEVVEYVRKNKGSLGVIGGNWISDGDDPASLSFIKSVRVLAVSEKETPASLKEYYLPFQYNLALEKYPLRREIFMITKEARRGLGTGLINFVLSHKGQLVIQKAGLLPTAQPIQIRKVDI